MKIAKVHPKDNVIAALDSLPAGATLCWESDTIVLAEEIPAKHKFNQYDLAAGDPVIMYGVLIGKATRPIPRGSRISRENVHHESEPFVVRESTFQWEQPDVGRWQGRTFEGFHRADGKVGTRNYWLVIPLVFCENRNIKVIQDAMLEQLGYVSGRSFSVDVHALVRKYQSGAGAEELLQTDIIRTPRDIRADRVFPNVDGIKFLTHDGGCGGTRQDSDALCQLLAGYIANPNVAGATVLSLGCQHAQANVLQEALKHFYPDTQKPVYILEQQKSPSERDLIAEAVKKTFVGLVQANALTRSPAPLSKLVLGLECGGSDGFSGLSANPALGQASDYLTALGGTAVLSEFPELNGVEQDLIDRCVHTHIAEKFGHLMQTYSNRAREVGSGFDMNPSPGNIRDGLITDAMKSAGAAKKGGTAPVTDVLDYTEPIVKPGLNLLCTPGNDVESTTALAGSGCTLIVFTTGLGTPTGNPITPTIKVSSNTALYQRMEDIIDLDAGTILSGEHSIASKGAELLDLMIEVASGTAYTKAELLGQDDFIPWKRGVSL
jgi:altronate hydrolase